ncbi:SH3 domain-containing protein [Metabacillus sp. HB246100]
MFKKKKVYLISVFVLILLTVGTLVMVISQDQKVTVNDLSNETAVQTSSEKIPSKQTTQKELPVEDTAIETAPEVIEDQKEDETELVNEENAKGEEKEPIKQEKVATPVTKYVAVSSLNVRSGPSLDNKVVGTVALNQAVQAVIENEKEAWLKITTDKISGYVNGKYLSEKKLPETEQVESAPSKQIAEQNAIKKASSESSAKKEQPKKVTLPEKQENTAPKNDAEKLTSIDSNHQLILVTTNGYGTSSAKIQTFERNTEGRWKQVLTLSGYIGKNGFASKKVEGDGKSPRGKFSIGTAFGRSGNPGTKLPFRSITSDDVWVDDSTSSLYNTWQSRKKTEGQWTSAENMDIPQYNYGFVINYNTSRVPGAGSAIFFHVSSGYTLGCTGVSQANMVSILKWLDPGKNPTIIQTPSAELVNY